MQRHKVDGAAAVRLTMRDLLAMKAGSMVQKRALLKLVEASKASGVKPAVLTAKKTTGSSSPGAQAALETENGLSLSLFVVKSIVSRYGTDCAPSLSLSLSLSRSLCICPWLSLALFIEATPFTGAPN